MLSGDRVGFAFGLDFWWKILVESTRSNLMSNGLG